MGGAADRLLLRHRVLLLVALGTLIYVLWLGRPYPPMLYWAGSTSSQLLGGKSEFALRFAVRLGGDRSCGDYVRRRLLTTCR